MKKILYATIVLLIFTSTVSALDDPHGAAASIDCGQCHISHSTLGDILVNSTDSLVSTLCLSCHTPGGWTGMTKFFSSSFKAQPGISGTSHSWDVDSANTMYGANQPQSPELIDHITKSGKVTCATCHDPHANSTPPFLRLDNSTDQLCLDCHLSRNIASVKTYTGSILSHPVGVALPTTTAFHNPPIDTDGNPQPSDGNTTNDFQFGAGNTMKCTSCHGVHYTDSNSGTVDGP